MARERKRNVIAEQLRKIREGKSLSQAALAAKLQLHGWDIDRIGISKIERCERAVSDAELFLLGSVLRVSGDEFMPSKSALRAFIESQRHSGRTKSRASRS